MPSIAKLFQHLTMPRMDLSKRLSSLYLVLGFLLALCVPQLASAQTQVTNTASISVPTGVSNTGAGCASGTCTVADIDAITASAPLVAKSFTPATISAGGTSLLVITFTNTHKFVSASFTTAFVDAYPTGLLNAAAPTVATTCSGPVPIATAGGTQISTPAGTVVAPNASCSISAVVTSVTSPLAANTIPAGSLTTSVGANPSLITATLTVNASANLAITKTTSNTTPNAGGTFTYTIVIGNSGPSDVTNATWTDTLPAGLGTITNVSPTGSITASVSGGTISGTTTLANGQLATLTFQVTVAGNAVGVLTNSASVTPPGTTNDPVLSNNFSTVTVTVTPVADLVITKTASTLTPNAGGTFTYTIQIGNNGPSAVTNATWTDTLPVGLGSITNVFAGPGVTATVAGTTIGGTSTLASGQTALVTFQVSVAANASGVLTNTASVNVPAGTTDPVTANNSSTVTVTVTPVADLVITKTASTSSPSVGSTFTYTIVIGNNGPSDVVGANWTDTLPAGLVLNPVFTASPGTTVTISGSTISGSSTIANGQLATITFQAFVAPGASGSIANVASVLPPPGTLDPALGNNSNTVTITVTPVSDLQITKTASTTTPNAGSTMAFVLLIGNNGPSTVTGASWSDALPAGLGTITNVIASAGLTATVTGNTISGSATLGLGQVANVGFVVTVAPTAAGSIINVATVTAPVGTIDPVLTNNISTITLTVSPVADLVVTKTASTNNPNAGGTFSYTIVIGNNGPSAMTGAPWGDSIPVGLGTITNVLTSAGITAIPSLSGPTGNFIGGTSTLASGQVATVTFQVSVAPGATGSLVNTVNVAPPAGTTDPVSTNNTATTTVTIGQLAALSVTKTNAVTSLLAGSTTSYTVTFANGGPSAANGALIKDAASAGLVCTSVTCAATTGGASCPSSMLPLGTVVPSGSTLFFSTGETITTFPANSSVSLVVVCGVTATGQ
jgi:uncharacterized repeat protein (TIGR01451 family)